jgi:hypothetical protein
MIFALGKVPKFFIGQELSAQDLNNLAQNVEIMEQVVKAPDRLFLSDWKLAPPLFKFVEQKTETGNLQTFEGLTFAMSLSDIDVWEGSFMYREGMHTLRLGFNTYAVKERLDGWGKTPLDLKDAYQVNYGKAGDNEKWVNTSTSLFLIVKYTDVPVQQLLTKHKKYVRTWVYDSTKKATYKQPADDEVNSFTFVDDSDAFDGHTWKANGADPRGYHEFTMDLTRFKFVPGEIVAIKFRIKTRDNKPVLSLGRRFYFSMVYANIDHDISSFSWKNIETHEITDIKQVRDVSENQRMLADYLSKYDMPLRAAIWDQVMVGTSHYPYYGRYMATALQELASWGLVHAQDYIAMDFNTSEARFYLPKNFDLKNTVSISYNVAVNTRSAFSLQGLLSKSAISSYMNKKDQYYESTKNSPSFIIAYNWDDDGNTKARYPWVVGLGNMNYQDFQTATGSRLKYSTFLSRVGLVNFMGKFSVDNQDDVRTSILPTGLSTPAGSPDPREFLYMAGTQPTSQNSWQGYYFILPGFITGKVPYYNSSTGNAVGLEENMFLGPKAVSGEFRDASIYVDNFNFTLKQQTGTGNASKYYPAIYDEYAGIREHPTYFYTANDNYTDFTINLKESSPSYSTAVGYYQGASGVILESFDLRAFNKASYIATFRLAEATRKTTEEIQPPERRFSSFDAVPYSGLIGYIQAINTRQKHVYNYIKSDPIFKYIPLFWTKPKSSLKHFEDLVHGSRENMQKRFEESERNTVYFSNIRQADYLVVRGRNVSIGWGGFTKVYRDNPDKNILFPAPLEIEFASSQSLTGSDIETVIIGFDTLKSLTYGERYYLLGDVFYAAETMGIPS